MNQTLKPMLCAVEIVPAKKLKVTPENVRKGNWPLIRQSLELFGWYGVLIVDKKSKRILVGNNRFPVACEYGYTEFPVQWFTGTPEEQAALLLLDNRTSDTAEYDQVGLAKVLEDMDARGTLWMAGWTPGQLDTFMDSLKKDLPVLGAPPLPERLPEVPLESAPAAVRGKASKPAPVVRQVTLHVPNERFQRFVDQVNGLKREWEVETVAAVILKALDLVTEEQES